LPCQLIFVMFILYFWLGVVATTFFSFMFNAPNKSMVLTATNDTFFPSFTHFVLWLTTSNLV
jgi:hypothetical protein